MSEPAPRAPSPPAIRPATDADVLAMAKLHIASWRETYPGMLPGPMLAGLSIAEQAIRWQRMLDRPDAWGEALTFVAERDGAIVGYGTCGEQRTRQLRDQDFTAEVTELYVLQAAQGQGTGSGLMHAMATALHERGHRALCLWVLEQNAPARRFYECLGGIPIAEKRARLLEVAYGWKDLGRLLSIRT